MSQVRASRISDHAKTLRYRLNGGHPDHIRLLCHRSLRQGPHTGPLAGDRRSSRLREAHHHGLQEQFGQHGDVGGAASHP